MQKIISILLTVVLLASNSGVVLAQHFCGEYKMMEEISFGAKELSCGMDLHSDCDSEETNDHDCCDNEYESLGVDNQINPIDVEQKTSVHTNFAAALVAVFVLDVPLATAQKNTNYKAYEPPPLIKDIPVLYESFLI